MKILIRLFFSGLFESATIIKENNFLRAEEFAINRYPFELQEYEKTHELETQYLKPAILSSSTSEHNLSEKLSNIEKLLEEVVREFRYFRKTIEKENRN